MAWYCTGDRLIFNPLRPRQNGRRFADDTFKRIFLNENVRISIEISLKFVPRGPINNIPTLVQIMAWRRPGDKPLSEPMMVSLPTHICVARPQWVNMGIPIPGKRQGPILQGIDYPWSPWLLVLLPQQNWWNLSNCLTASHINAAANWLMWD